MNRIAWIGLAIVATVLCGCPRSQPTQPSASDATPAATRASVALRLLVVNDPPLVESINRLRGEWAERSGGELVALPMTWAELAQAKKLDADLIIFPSRYLGELCTLELLRPVRTSVLEDHELDASDYFPVVRNELIKWDRETFALPLGIDHSAIAPNFKQPNAITLLTIAVPQAISNDRLGVLFDTDSMKPLITEPPFIEALKKIAAGSDAAKNDPANEKESSIPVLGDNDRLVSVTSSSRNAASAFKLLEWLALPDTNSQFARIGGSWLPPRRSLTSSAAWFDASLSSNDRAARGKKIEAALGGEWSLVIPRIPGVDEYLTALD